MKLWRYFVILSQCDKIVLRYEGIVSPWKYNLIVDIDHCLDAHRPTVLLNNWSLLYLDQLSVVWSFYMKWSNGTFVRRSSGSNTLNLKTNFILRKLLKQEEVRQYILKYKKHSLVFKNGFSKDCKTVPILHLQSDENQSHMLSPYQRGTTWIPAIAALLTFYSLDQTLCGIGSQKKM